ncbi:hypothetical protein EN909_31830, partial [Mesorhizobium sp. M7A.F.Ca.CA.004.07.1.1]
MFADIIRPITLGFSLLRRFWPQLMALVLAGVLVGDLLMQLAAKVALANHFAASCMRRSPTSTPASTSAM